MKKYPTSPAIFTVFFVTEQVCGVEPDSNQNPRWSRKPIYTRIFHIILGPDYCCVPPNTAVLSRQSVGLHTGKRLTNRQPKLILVTIFPPGTAECSSPDRTYLSTCHQLAVPIYWGQERVFSGSTRIAWGSSAFVLKGSLWRVVRIELATQNPCSAVDAIC